MIIGVPKEIKTEENRVGLTPLNVKTLVSRGHEVLIQRHAGEGSGFLDDAYEKAGAKLVADAAELYGAAALIVKIKEPLESEYPLITQNHILFTYLHLAANETLTRTLLESGVKAFAYESMEADGRLPLLEPMSEIAGKMAALAGANLLARVHGGSGLLISGMAGVVRGNVVIIGSGTVGKNAARLASGMGADVTVLGRNSAKLGRLQEMSDKNVTTRFSNEETLKTLLPDADLVVGAVLQKDARTPHVITEAMIKSMKPGSVFVDVSIDQGGCSETSRPTTHKEPTFQKHGVIHYCVANMPGAYARTATLALTNNTLPYVTMLADLGFDAVLKQSAPMRTALNLASGTLYNEAIARTFGLQASDL